MDGGDNVAGSGSAVLYVSRWMVGKLRAGSALSVCVGKSLFYQVDGLVGVVW